MTRVSGSLRYACSAERNGARNERNASRFATENLSCKIFAHRKRGLMKIPRRQFLQLALLWQIYSRRGALQIHIRQCGHRCGGGRAKNSRMALRTAGKVG